jgi:hypothetical protein
MPFNRPNVIMQALRKVEELHASSLSTRISAQKRKAMSDITNRLDNLPAAKRLRN